MIALAVILTALACALIGGYFVHEQAKRAETAETERDDALTDLERVCRLLDDTEAVKRTLARRWNKATDNAAWWETKHTIVLAELDRLTERHAVLLSLDGIRADAEDGIRYQGNEPPMSVAVREGAEVVELRGRR